MDYFSYTKMIGCDNVSLIYKVQKGDNLYSIAKKFDTSVSDLINLNQLHNTLLSIGQVLMIPNDLSSSIGSDLCGSYQEQEDVFDTYQVKKGDSLYSIAQKYHTDMSTLMHLNNLKNSLLSVNQILKVPHQKDSFFSYQVKEQDTLYSIASNYNVTPQQLMDLNNLTTTMLEVGTILKIPKKEA